MVTSLDGIEAAFRDTRAWIALVLGLGLCGAGLHSKSRASNRCAADHDGYDRLRLCRSDAVPDRLPAAPRALFGTKVMVAH